MTAKADKPAKVYRPPGKTETERGPFNENVTGQIPGKCNARKRGSSGYCGQAAGWGTDHAGIGHCKLHGGSSPGQRTKADNDRLDQTVRTMLERENLVPLDNPIAQLQMLAAEVVAFKNILGSKVEELRGWSYDDISDKEDLRAIILAYERALDRTQKTLVEMARLNIEERLARLNEAQANLLKQVVEAVLDSKELGLNKVARQTGRTILARQLTLVTGAA